MLRHLRLDLEPQVDGHGHAVEAGADVGDGAGYADAQVSYNAPSQLQDLSECTGITIEFDRRLDILQRSVRILEARAGEHDHGGRILLDLSFQHEPEEKGEGRRRRGFREQSLR